MEALPRETYKLHMRQLNQVCHHLLTAKDFQVERVRSNCIPIRGHKNTKHRKQEREWQGI